MSEPIRADLDAIPLYVPGKAAPDALKLSSNEVPYGPLPGVVDAITATATEVHRYPDLAATALTQRLSERLAVGPERIATGTGSVALIGHLMQALASPGSEVVYSWRSFEAYPIAATVAGLTSVQVPNAPDHRHDLHAMAKAVGPDTRAIVVCSPNNPTGPVATADELDELFDSVPESVLIVIDEAYREFVTDPASPDALERYGDRPNAVVFRTFSKAWGLAGLRVGYMVASPEVAAAVRKCVIPFAVNVAAQSAALAALDAEEEMRRRVALVVAERERTIAAAREIMPGIPDSQANFFWLPLAGGAVDFAAHCQRLGILVRPFAGDGVRVTFGRPEDNDRMLEALRSFSPTNES
ncbi:histidinol-phosphate transaminase [Glycomyces buryatensis]|uniref:Aromatic amino acid aminotransferase n=1 Tax=Glycomyces buryatensis TaxID=2570927 RepID=A0A4S8PU81_9ACTN|nr:histidinol-phosphate transaminase [Glycomyces buryatensis]THV33931.1 aminotransferase class I/II-fold pyridoxal phosphate-dependent enzyme [Glycomyces buryatensis]